MKIVTHDSIFHTDDICAVATLLLIVGEAEVVRSRDPEVRSGADYVVDTGMEYDPVRRLFDHHQPEGAGVRENGIPYASFGLVWKEFGEKLAGGKREAELIDRKLVQPVDAHDNGVALAESRFEGIQEYSIGDFFKSFIEARDSASLYAVFMHNVEIAKELLVREIKIAQRIAADQDKIRNYYEQSPDKRLIVLPEDLRGWGEFLREKPEVLYVVYPRPDGHWSVGTIRADESYALRKSLPAAWAGMAGEELQKLSGVSDAIFCHRNCFMAAAVSKEGATKLAEIALNS